MKNIYYFFVFCLLIFVTIIFLVCDYFKQENSNYFHYLRLPVKPFIMTKDCLTLLNNSNSAYSQFGQDLFLYNNFFKDKYNGYYVEIGAYHPTFLSNIALFDQCLNWSGICFDMNDFHKNEYTKRNCKLIQTCISNRSYVDYYKQDDSLANGKEGTSRTYCTSTNQLFENYKIKHKIDLLSIDIEGDEYYALQTFPFNKYSVDYVLVETYHNNHREDIFNLLEEKGFVHVIQIGPDDLFENTKRQYWFPEKHTQWKKDISNNVDKS
jgi:hypothetical protein